MIILPISIEDRKKVFDNLKPVRDFSLLTDDLILEIGLICDGPNFISDIENPGVTKSYQCGSQIMIIEDFISEMRLERNRGSLFCIFEVRNSYLGANLTNRLFIRGVYINCLHTIRDKKIDDIING